MLTAALVGRLLQALAPAPTESVLEIGAGTGYVTACLASLGRSVRSFEIFPDLAAAARRNLASLVVTNAEIVSADAFGAAPSAGRYDVIAVTGSLPVYSPVFERQLEVGGRLFVVVGTAPIMEARLVRRVAEEAFVAESLFETSIDGLVNAPQPAAFVF
jgi:protein-L-isoaspartate(D-aspartate) O-methyltransferase